MWSPLASQSLYQVINQSQLVLNSLMVAVSSPSASSTSNWSYCSPAAPTSSSWRPHNTQKRSSSLIYRTSIFTKRRTFILLEESTSHLSRLSFCVSYTPLLQRSHRCNLPDPIWCSRRQVCKVKSWCEMSASEMFYKCIPFCNLLCTQEFLLSPISIIHFAALEPFRGWREWCSLSAAAAFIL